MKWVTSLSGSCFLLAVLAGCGGGGSNTSTSNNGNNSGGSNGGSSPLPAGTELLYVGDNVGVIHGFGVDPDSGKLTPLPSVAVTNQAAAADVGLAADFGGMVLYATSAGLGGPNVFSYIVDKHTGALTASGSVALPVPPRKLAAIEGNLYVIPDPSANAAQMFAFSINGTAALTQLSPTVTLPGPPHDLVVAGFGNDIPSWMGLTFDGTSGGEIQGIVRQPNGGATGLQLGSPTSSGGNSPQGIRVTPDGKFVVVVNQGTNNVSVFSLNATTGTLTEVPGSPFATGQQPSPVAIDPTALSGLNPTIGKFVFVGDTGGNSLSAYTIDSAGSLTPVSGTPIPLGDNAQPSSIAVDPSGKFVFVGIVPKEVAGFTMDPSDGSADAD